MSNLGSQQINATYGYLLQIPGGLTSSLVTVQDGSGNNLPLSISTTGAIGTFTGGTINGMVIGGVNPAAGTFTTIGGTTITASTQFTGPGTGLTGTASSLSVGGSAGSVSGSVAATTLSASGVVTINTTTNNQSYTTTGAGAITITSGTAGNINNMNIGATTAGTGAFTTLSASSTVSGTGFSTYLASPPAIGTTTPAAGKFTNLEYTGTFTGGTGILNIGSGQVYKDSSGNVGIGTTGASAAGAKFVVSNSGAEGLEILTTTANTIGIQSYNRSTSAYILQSYVGSYFTWTTGGAGERMRIDSSGNVGIGTSSPSKKLSVYSASAGASFVNIYDASGTSGANPTLQFGVYDSNGFNTSDAARVWTTSPSSTTASLNFAAYNGAIPSTAQMVLTGGNVGIGTSSPNRPLEVNGSIRFASGGIIECGSTAVNTYIAGISGASGYWAFATNSSERMRIDSSGNLLVGTTTNTANCGVVVQCNSGSRSGFSTQTTNAAANGSMYFINPNGIVGNIVTTGTTTVYNTSSDQRLKTNVQPAGSAIQSILDFPVDQFDWIADGSHQDFGAVAQKAFKVIPEMVAIPADENEMWGIDWSKAVPRLIKTIQELSAKVTELESKLNS